MFNLPDDIIDLIMEYKVEAEKIDKENKIFKDNKNKMIKELKGVISYAKFNFMEYCRDQNLNYIDWDDHINTNTFVNEILYSYEHYTSIY
jgi:hypothetical protein